MTVEVGGHDPQAGSSQREVHNRFVETVGLRVRVPEPLRHEQVHVDLSILDSPEHNIRVTQLGILEFVANLISD